MKPTRRVLAWIIDRKDEKKTLLWPMAWTVDRDISKVARDRQTGELYQLDHPEAGYDVSFDVEGEAATRKYTGIQLARRPSSVSEQFLDFIVSHPLPDCLIWRSYAEMLELLSPGGAPASSGRAIGQTSGPVVMPSGLSPRAQARWEEEHGVVQQEAVVQQERVPLAERPTQSDSGQQQSSSAQTAVSQSTRAQVADSPATASRSDPALNPTEAAGSAGAPAADTKPVAQTAAPAGVSDRAAALRARFAK